MINTSSRVNLLVVDGQPAVNKLLKQSFIRRQQPGFANRNLSYVLHTDTSTVDLGAALYQERDGVMRAIAFASRESRYPPHKLKFLPPNWAVTDNFCDYLYEGSFTVVTDSNPLI